MPVYHDLFNLQSHIDDVAGTDLDPIVAKLYPVIKQAGAQSLIGLTRVHKHWDQGAGEVSRALFKGKSPVEVRCSCTTSVHGYGMLAAVGIDCLGVGRLVACVVPGEQRDSLRRCRLFPKLTTGCPWHGRLLVVLGFPCCTWTPQNSLTCS